MFEQKSTAPVNPTDDQKLIQSLQDAYEILLNYPDNNQIYVYYMGFETDDEAFKEAALTILRAVFKEPEYPDFSHKSVSWLTQQAAYKIRDLVMRESLSRKIEEMSEDGKIAIFLTGRVDCDGVHMQDEVSFISADVDSYYKECELIHRNSDGRYNLSIEKPSSVIKSQNGDDERFLTEDSIQLEISITYEKLTQEDLEAGEPSERGHEQEHERIELGELDDLALEYGFNEASCSDPTSAPNIWFSTTEPRMNRDYLENGIHTYFSLHIHKVNGCDPTAEDYQMIADRLGVKFHTPLHTPTEGSSYAIERP